MPTRFAAAFTTCQIALGVIPSPQIFPSRFTRRKIGPPLIAAAVVHSARPVCHRRSTSRGIGSSGKRRTETGERRGDDGSELSPERKTMTPSATAKGCGKAASWKSPQNGLSHCAWKSTHTADSHDSSVFRVLLPFFDAQPGRSFYPLARHPGSVARSWRRPFPCRGVASPQTPAPDPESFPATIAQSTRVGPHPRRFDDDLGASNSSAPIRNRTEALDTALPSQSHEQAKVSHSLLLRSPSEARPEGAECRTHSCGCRNEAT